MPQCQPEKAALDAATKALNDYQQPDPPPGHGPRRRDPNNGYLAVLIEAVNRCQRAFDACMHPPVPLPNHQDIPIDPPDHRAAKVPFGPPCAVTFPSNQAEHDIVLMAVTEDGLATSFWDHATPRSNSGEWSRWFDTPNTSGVPVPLWHTNMVAVGWIDPVSDHTRVNGFIGTGDSGIDSPLITPWLDLPDRADLILDTMMPPLGARTGREFDPWTSASWQQGQVGRLNVFGTAASVPLKKNLLRELYWDGGGWHWTDHFTPGDSTISLGPGSLLLNQYEGFLFGIANASVRLYHWLPTQDPQWQWYDLDKPDNVPGTSMRSPLAVSHFNDNTGLTEVNVFVTGFNEQTRDWHLYEKHWTGEDIEDWSDWADRGTPPVVLGPNNTTGGQTPSAADIENFGFRMTCAAVWTDLAGALRINLFGYTDCFEDTNIHTLEQGGQLVEYWWDGARWDWGSLTADLAFSPEPPQRFEVFEVPEPLAIKSAIVLRRGPRVHLSVFGSTEQGAIWERCYDTWTYPNWAWIKH
jgi:hypothetical protein